MLELTSLLAGTHEDPETLQPILQSDDEPSSFTSCALFSSSSWLVFSFSYRAKESLLCERSILWFENAE